MDEHGGDAPVRALRAVDPPTGARAARRTVEVVVRRAVITAAVVVLVAWTAATGDWEGLLGVVGTAAAVALILVPLFWSLNNPRSRPRPKAVPPQE